MIKYKLIDIEKKLNGKFFGNPKNEFSRLLTDSRKTVSFHESLFISISGEQHDGHKYISELYKNGVRSFIISQKLEIEKYPEASFLQVENCVKALQKLSFINRSKYKNPLIAITGSNGKTIVKEWLFHLLSPTYNITRSPKSYNSQIGVPLSLWLIDKNTELAIIEAGISQPGEMEKLETIIKPDIGILTNIGSAHQSNFSDYEQKLEEKSKLFKDCKSIICNIDYKSHKNTNSNYFTWSDSKKEANIFVNSKKVINDQTKLQLTYNNDEYFFNIPFTDNGSIENAITCFCSLCLLYKSPDRNTLKRFEALPQIKMRLETIDAVNNSILINDTYNSDINSLEIALDYLNQKKANKSSVLIMSDILQNSTNLQSFYKDLSSLIKEKKIEKFIGVGQELSKHKTLFGSNAIFHASTSDFLDNLSYTDFDKCTILLKGAREFRFEEISKKFQAKSHESYLETNMNLMRENLMYFHSIIHHETKIMAMVKAFSYGSGYREISAFLQHNRIDYLAVAYTDEGIELRNAGIYTPIMVMNPSAKDFRKMTEYNLEPEIYSLALLKQLKKELSTTKDNSFPIHIKINTGMNRLGFNSIDIPELCSIIKDCKKIEIKSIFSHLVGSDDKKHDSYTHEQINAFEEIYSQIVKVIETKPWRHILNSAGINRFPEYQYEMVRLGIGLYGLMPELSDKLHQVSEFKSIISQIHNVKKGESIGYNRSGIVNKNSLIATIPVGYADGLDRRLGNGNWYFIINGEKAYTIGDICMDMCMIDISEIKASEDDEVIIFGHQNNILMMSKSLKTIPYEVITGISQRVKRIYTEE